MGLADVIFNRNQTGIGRPLPNNDHISGILMYAGSLPSGFASGDRIKIIYSLGDAENLGIVDTFSDETKPTGGNILMTAPGAAGDVSTIKIDDAVIGSYTTVTSDTNDLVATGLRAAINALTYLTGYSAAGSGANVALTAPVGLGVSINASTHLAATHTGTAASTATQFTGGKGSEWAVLHYHISEFFRMNPNGKLYVGIYSETGTYAGTEVQTMQNYAGGEIRQMAVYMKDEALTTGQLTATETFLDACETAHKPLNVLFHSDMTSLTLATLSDLSAISAKRVSVVIGQDGNWSQQAYSNTKAYIVGDKIVHSNKWYICKSPATGYSPFDTTKWTVGGYCLNRIAGYTISCLGNALGCVSLSAVHECIGWVNKFDISTGNNMDVAAFVTGDLYDAQTTSLLTTIDSKHYIFIRSYVGISGVYYQDSWTAVTQTNDYATIENNRAMDKAVRNIRTALLPYLLSPLYVDSTTGLLSEATIAVFKNISNKQLEVMQTNGEISGGETTINPAQNVLTSQQVVISVEIVPVGKSKGIVVNIGFALKLS